MRLSSPSIRWSKRFSSEEPERGHIYSQFAKGVRSSATHFMNSQGARLSIDKWDQLVARLAVFEIFVLEFSNQKCLLKVDS